MSGFKAYSLRWGNLQVAGIDDPLEFETLAAALKLDQKAASEMVEALAKMLEGCLPQSVEVQRGGWLLSKVKPVEKLTVKFDEVHYQVVKEANGQFSAKSLKVVRGVALKSTDIGLDSCLQEVVAKLTEMAANNAVARQALNKFVIG